MIDILMATYNGEKYIREQLNSIINQSYTDWRLIIRDDGSVDGTLGIIKEYCAKYEDRIILVSDNKGNLGFQYNFMELLILATADYVMFCDQDDIWLPDKVELTYKKMLELEDMQPNVPIMVHTNLYIYDGITYSANHTYHKKHMDEFYNLRTALMFSVAVECTLMMNSFYKDLDLSNIYGASHGYFLTLACLSHNGILYYLDQPTILYRQHGNNQIGESIDSQPWRKIKNIVNVCNYKSSIERTKKYRMNGDIFICNFYKAFERTMSGEAKEVFEMLFKLKRLNGIQCVYGMRKNGFLRGDWYTVLVTAFYYMFWRSKDRYD